VRIHAAESKDVAEPSRGVDYYRIALDHLRGLDDYELIAQQLSGLTEQLTSFENRMSDVLSRVADVEAVSARLEEAALITARALEEISGHWDAVYEAMRRKDESQDPQTS
jgi:dsDNA-specific endonuclease/ATPase MutS2